MSYLCVCGKSYVQLTNLYAHRKNCDDYQNYSPDLNAIKEQLDNLTALLLLKSPNANPLENIEFTYYVSHLPQKGILGILQERYEEKGVNIFINFICSLKDHKTIGPRKLEYQNLIVRLFCNENNKLPFQKVGQDLNILTPEKEFVKDVVGYGTAKILIDEIQRATQRLIVDNCRATKETIIEDAEKFEAKVNNLFDDFNLRLMQDYVIGVKKDITAISKALIDHPHRLTASDVENVVI